MTVDFYDLFGAFICSREVLFIPPVGVKVTLKHPKHDTYFDGVVYEVCLDLRNNPVYSVYIMGAWE